MVQCVPTKKGHQILYKGYTYVFKSRLQCGAEQWCCSSRQRTETELPEWVSIYFLTTVDNEQKCNICQLVMQGGKNSMDLLEHIKTNHREIYDLHKENPEATVGFRIEFLNLNVLKEDGDPKTQPIIIGEMCEATTEEITKQEFLVPVVKKTKSDKLDLTRKKSWVWKYFIRLSSIIYRCNLCDVVLSIKGCNTNNLNRHVRTKHPIVYQSEVDGKKQVDLDVTAELDPHNIKEEIVISERELDISQGTPIKNNLQKRSWIWLYFDRVSSKLAQCKLCKRNICHGGNATGNMNRHLKMKHNKTGHDHSWIWKVFDNTEDDVYACKICQYRCMRFNDIDKSVSCILHHLKLAHGVISGEQIITSIECGDDED